MTKNTDILKIFGIGPMIMILLLNSCKNLNDRKTEVAYLNFSTSSVVQMDGKFVNQSRLIPDAKLIYEVVFSSKDKIDSPLVAYFEYNGVQYIVPKKIRNEKTTDFKYSLMPHYISNDYTVAKRKTFANYEALIIRGESPFCNGSNCANYYVHLLVFKKQEIIANIVYLFRSLEVDFDKLNMSIEGREFVLRDTEKKLDKLLLEQ